MPPREPARPVAGSEGGDRPTLRFSGLPARVQALLPRDPQTLADARLSLEVDGETVAVPAIALAAGPGHAAVRLVPALPLPAGSYRGRLVAGGQAWDAEIEVAAEARARAYPGQLQLSGAGTLDVELDLVNVGNVPVEVRPAYAVPLEQAGVLDRAIVAGLTSQEGGVQRWGAAADAVAASQSGVARLAVRDGAGSLPPGEARRLVATLQLPDRVAAGGTHIGLWRLDGVAIAIEVAVPAETHPDPSRIQPGG